MLDYKKLSQQANKLFESFSKENLEDWISFDEERLMKELTSGKTIGVNCDTLDINYLISLGDNSNSFCEDIEETYYSKSA